MTGKTESHPLPDSARKALKKARFYMGVEHLVRAITPFLATVLLLLSLILFGLIEGLPTWGLLIFGLFCATALIFSLSPFRQFTWPSRADAASRVERESGFRFREISTLNDDLAVGEGDYASEHLWQIHRDRAAAAVVKAKPGDINPQTGIIDQRALRAIPVLLFFVAVLFAGDDWKSRFTGLAAETTPQDLEASMRIDTWVSPPVYTGHPPIVLSGATMIQDQADAMSLRVPESSVLAVRVTPPEGISLVRIDGDALAPIEQSDGSNPEIAADFRLALESTETFALVKDGVPFREWSFSIIPDEAPTIEFTEDPSEALSGALQLSYSMTDDHGVMSAGARFKIVGDNPSQDDGAEPLFDAPDFALVLPEARVKSGQAQTIRELQSHPWAGATVDLTLEAIDDAGQSGLSQVHRLELPQRTFRNPLAAALVDERRILALDARKSLRVANALDALAIAPEEYTPNTSHYLLLRSAYWRLQSIATKDELRDFVDYLWGIALVIEDGDLSLAEQRLRDAQQALMDALENGASDQEIAELMSDLREAMQDFLRELAQNAENMPQSAEQQPMDPSQMMTGQDLQEMLDQIEEMARSGARDAARQMLSELQNMMENLRNAQRMPQQQQGDSQMSESLQELQEMIQRQQELMDQTFQMQQGRQNQQGQPQQPGEGQPGQQGQNGQGSFQDQLDQLGQGQGNLREALENLMNQLGQMGVDPGQSLGQAGEAMEGAEGNLRGAQPGQALEDQAQALDQLRQGAQDMTQQMMQSMGQQGDSPNSEQRDPLGRPQRTEGPDLGNTVEVPDEIDMQRAREILNELRDRLSNPSRPKIEKDYLERLITPY